MIGAIEILSDYLNYTGYIQTGPELGQGYGVAQFVENPSESVATKYLASGNYLWNSGMFIVYPSILLAEAEKYCPELKHQCQLVVE